MAFSTNMVLDEKFEEIYPTDEKRIQLLNNGKTALNIKIGLHSCVLGIRSYSSGIHRIRISIDKGIAILGIRSRNIPPIPDENLWGQYGYDPSTYGWGRAITRLLSGNRSYSTETNIVRDPGVYILTLNCDEHRLSIVNENTQEQDEIKVDIACAPFPWCLFIPLARWGAQVSLI